MDRFLNLTDDNFVVDVKEDLNYFISKQRSDSVLVFPPVSNYRRFLIHRSVEELGQLGLTTFSIGVSDERRTVVCFKKRLLSNEACAKPVTMGLTEFNEAPIANTGAVVGACKPALEQSAQPRREKIRAKPRRPDRQVYVPRALRTSNPPSNETTSPEPRKRPSQSAEGHKIHTSPPPRDKSQPATPRKSIDKTFCNVYTPPHLRIQKSQPKNTPCQDTVPSVPKDSDSAITSDNFYIGDYINGQFGIYPSYFSNYLRQNYSLDTNVTMAVPENHSNFIDNNGYSHNKDEDVEKNELIKASQEINRSSKRIIKQTFDSDVLVISDSEPEELKQREIEEEKKLEPDPKRPKAKLEARVSLKREENDWDAVFDDSGECLDPSLLEELTSTVGKVHISKTKNDYGPYQTKAQALFNGPYDETFGHVIEVYDFPSEFKTNDLLSVFSEYKDTGFEIKWVDDTHALICFSSAKIAAEVLSTQRPLVRCRPLHAATIESRTKAKKCAEFLQPYRQRPETCTALARRLVTGALGVKLSTASQERAEERRIITAAREKKRQAALHKEAAWEGSLANQTQTSTADS